MSDRIEVYDEVLKLLETECRARLLNPAMDQQPEITSINRVYTILHDRRTWEMQRQRLRARQSSAAEMAV